MKWLLLVLPLLAVAASAWGANLTGTSGETFIKYSWDSGYSVMIYHNGVWDSNSTLNYLYLSNLKPSERHRLTLYNRSNATEILGDVTQETAPPSTMYYVIAGIGLIFLILCILFTPSPFATLDGLFAATIFGILSTMLAVHSLTMVYLALALAVLPAMLMIWNVYKMGTARYI